MKRYKVCYRIDADHEWTDEFYPEQQYIEAEDEEEALYIAKEFAIECGCEPSDYDWMVQEAEE